MIRHATAEDIVGILEIFNYNILNTTAIYMYEPQTLEQRLQWFQGKVERNEPLFVYELDGKVVGYSTYGPFRAYPAYQYTVEHSVYVHQDYHRKGIARELMQVIIEEAEKNGMKTMVGCINSTNEASIKAHEKFGFTYSGTVRNAGYKFGEWLHLSIYQLDLKGPNV